MSEVKFHDRLLDARPDRIDLRDRMYSPRLQALPQEWPSQADIHQHLQSYEKLILNQGSEGACTGFGLAAAVNYLIWRRAIESSQPKEIKPVSPRMFYHLARLYDEWPGEDYEGSSCRGAMKGWHRHGICLEELWPYRNAEGKEEFVPPAAGWQQDAAKRPLGAYYRIDKGSISDLQSAIYEVGAVYVSCRVHEGWRLPQQDCLSLIPGPAQESGGHAFALVGYTIDGFIVQNSWGSTWGYRGFAVLTYEDWVSNGMDAWVAVLGAPTATTVPATQVDSSLLPRGTSRENNPLRLRAAATDVSARIETQPVSEETVFRHSIVMGNNGIPINRLIDRENAAMAVKAVAQEFPLPWLLNQPQNARKIAIYAHGGLNEEPFAVRRARVMLPYYLANGIYPLFVIWKTGPMETLWDLIQDQMGQSDTFAGSGVFEEAFDRTFEQLAHTPRIRSIWTEMKQNAFAGTRTGGALTLLADRLKELHDQVPGLEIHLIGHSAGAILHGHLLDTLLARGSNAKTISLWAPACTVEFANQHFTAALTDGSLFSEILSWPLEKQDTVGPYHKSLLYLVSRALEDFHKTPILGLQPVWVRQPDDQSIQNLAEVCSDDQLATVHTWQNSLGARTPSILTNPFTPDGVTFIPTNHGSFDNNLEVLTRALKRIKGSDLTFPVDNLHDLPAGGFFSTPAPISEVQAGAHVV